MENKKRKSTGLLLSILGVISLVLITAGVTYAFFSYAKQGEKDNTITTGSITFIYNETGNALTINDALPKSDTIGMGENSSSNFEFEVTSTTPSTAYINYIVTAKKSNSSTLPENQVKLYLTSTGSTDGTTGVTPATTMGSTAGSVLTYSALPAATSALYPTIFPTTATQHADEKVLYVGQVPASSADKYDNHADYAKTFKLNMWLVGGEEKCFVDNVVNNNVTTKTDCEALTPTAGVWKADTTGMADYSAYEFVKLSSLTRTGTGTELDPYVYDNTQYTVGSTAGENVLVKDTDILTSVAYYTALENGTINASEYTRLAAVNQTNSKVFTVAQVTSGNTAPTTTGWAASEQYYPFNGGTFTITINVYAEGATNYQAGA